MDNRALAWNYGLNTFEISVFKCWDIHFADPKTFFQTPNNFDAFIVEQPQIPIMKWQTMSYLLVELIWTTEHWPEIMASILWKFLFSCVETYILLIRRHFFQTPNNFDAIIVEQPQIPIMKWQTTSYLLVEFIWTTEHWPEIMASILWKFLFSCVETYIFADPKTFFSNS